MIRWCSESQFQQVMWIHMSWITIWYVSMELSICFDIYLYLQGAVLTFLKMLLATVSTILLQVWKAGSTCPDSLVEKLPADRESDSVSVSIESRHIL